MKNMIFYISSRGSSASTWLAKVLSRHPKIVTFQSTRTLPPASPGTVPDMPVDLFFDGLLACVHGTLEEKVFGSVHGYHGAIAKDACESRGGLFSYITRHHVERIGSYYVYMADIYYKENGLGVTNEKVLDRMSEFGSKQEFNDMFEMFSVGCEHFFGFEREVFDACGGPGKGIEMERMISSPQYFREHIWPLIVPWLEIGDDYLNDIYQVGRVGIHRKDPVAWETMWSKWPSAFKNEFLRIFDKFHMAEVAESFNYDMKKIGR